MSKPYMRVGGLVSLAMACLSIEAQEIVPSGPEKVVLGGVTLFSGGEGKLKSVSATGQFGWTVTQGQYLYGNVLPKSKTSPHLRLEFDVNPHGYRGAIEVPYDSSDPRSFGDPHQWGAWKPSQFALDGQTNWVTASVEWTDGRLDSRCNGYDFRLQLPKEPAVVIGNVRVVALPPVSAADRIGEASLGNSEMEIAFSSNGVSRIASAKLGVTFVHNGQSPLFRLQVKPPGKAAPHWLASTDAKLAQRELRETNFVQRFQFGEGIDVICQTALQGPDSRWELSIVNNSQLEVAAAQYPIFQGARIGDDHRDDTLVVPAVWRQVIRNPVEAQFSQGRGLRDLAMHWAYLHDDNAGLYIGDHNWPVRDVVIGVARNDPISLTLDLVREFCVSPGQTREFKEYVVAVRSGGEWHPAADIYRAWAGQHLVQRPLPAWTERMDGWFNFPSDRIAYHGYSLMGPAEDRARERGLGFYMGANRGQIDGPIIYVGMWPVYCPAWGSLQELKETHRELRERGGHANWYMNWQLMSPADHIGRQRVAGVIPKDWVEHPTFWPDESWYANTAYRGFQWGAKPSLGEEQDEPLQGICSPSWQKHQLEGAELWAGYGADGMYYDQISCNAAVQCLDPAYNASGDYGTWTLSSIDSLRRVTEKLSHDNSHFITSGELANDVIGQQLTFHMTSGVYNHIELLRYCMPTQGILDGGWNGGVNPQTGGAERWRFIWLTGARFEGIGEGQYEDALVALRRRARALIYSARFMDTVDLTLARGGKSLSNPPTSGELSAMNNVANGMNYGGNTPVIARTGVELAVTRGPQAKWFLLSAPHRGAVVNVIQDPPGDGSAQPLSVGLPASRIGKIDSAWALNIDGSTDRLDVKERDGQYTVNLRGDQKAITVVLAERVFPMVQDLDLPFAAAPGSMMRGLARVANYGGKKASGQLVWNLPPGWTATTPAFELDPGVTREVAVEISVPASAPKGQRIDLTLGAKVGATSTSFPHWITPSDPLSLRLFRHSDGTVRATVFNQSSKPIAGAVRIETDSGARAGLEQIPFSVEQWGKTEFKVPISGITGLASPARIRAKAVVQNSPMAARSLMLYPAAVNGDFEADSAGDDHPDWWTPWGEGDAFNHSRFVALDTKDPFSGKRCLRLDPDPHHGLIRVEPMIRFIDKGRYRVRFAMKKTAADDQAYLQVFGVRLGSNEAGKWVVVEKDFTVGGDADGFNPNFVNGSKNPVWFDAFSIKPLDKTN